MIKQSNAKIFVSQRRAKEETATTRIYQTFNTGSFFNEHKAAFGNLYVLNDVTLAPDATTTIQTGETCYIVLMPVAGAVEYTDSTGNEGDIMAGEAYTILLKPGSTANIKNPYPNHLVNYIQLCFKPTEKVFTATKAKASFNIDEKKNELVAIFPENIDLPFRLNIIKLDGRAETLYEPENKQNGVYAYVIEGAFEVQYRMLHERDGLALWDIAEIEAEALSNNAILLIVEVCLK